MVSLKGLIDLELPVSFKLITILPDPDCSTRRRRKETLTVQRSRRNCCLLLFIQIISPFRVPKLLLNRTAFISPVARPYGQANLRRTQTDYVVP